MDIFVFGSNLAGRHKAGAAARARKRRGAIYGRGIGLQNYSYAIPIKGWELEVLSLDVVRGYVNDFLAYAKEHLNTTFEVTRIGCGRAGYTDAQIAPMFAGAPSNCKLPVGWRKISATDAR
jgi:hypothetical protein